MAQFPTNNYDSTHGGVDENNNPNTPEIANANKGKARTGDALYSDKHYLDGDGFLYGLGMASLRQIVKGKDDDITTKYFYWSAGKSTASKLGLKIPAIAEDLAGAGLWSSTGKLNLMLYTKINSNVNESGLIIPEASATYSSGLKINTGKALHIGNNSTDTATYGKLNVLYDDITIKLDSQGRLKVDGTAIVPNIQPSSPITVDTSGNNKIIGLKLKNTTESGQTIYSSGLDADSNGLFVKLGDNSIANGNNGLYVDWAMAPWGVGLEYISGNIKVKPATTSEIGGVKLGANATPDTGMDSTIHYLQKDGLDAAYINTYVYNDYPTTNAAEHYPYSAAYIIRNYSTNTQVDTKIASAISDISGREYKIFPKLPAKSESLSWADFYAAYKKYIALVSNTGSEPDAYKEYILIVTNESTGECHWEQIGDTQFTTDNFVAKTDVLTQAEVASIVQDVFGF